MLSLKIENKYGQQLDFTNNPDYVVKVTGLTPPSATINSSKAINKPGSIYNSGSLDDRNIVLMIYPQRDIEKRRNELYKFAQSNEYIKLYLKTGIRNVWIDGYVDSVDGDFYEQPQVIQVSILCVDPHFKNMILNVVDFSAVSGGLEFEITPTTDGLEFGTISNYVEKIITNEQHIETGVIIDISASELALEPTIHNTTTNQSLTINHEFQPGDIVRIDTRSRHKSITLIRNGVETDIFNTFDKNSKWLTVIPGDNIFSYTALHGQNQLNVTITTEEIFGGI